MKDETKEAVLVPPYVSFATFSNFLKNLGQHVPGRIGLYPVWWTPPLGHRGHLLEVYRTYVSQC
jgi:hypothetical protein